MEAKQVLDTWNTWAGSEERKVMGFFKSYYDVDNAELEKRVKDRDYRNKKPNNEVPSAYYTTVVDTMAGYMFSEVQYSCEDEAYSETLHGILKANRQQVKDMKAGILALAMNRSVEYVYIKDKLEDVRFSSVSPFNVALVYDDSIEPELTDVVRMYDWEDASTFKLSHVDKDFETLYQVTKGKDIVMIGTPKELPFKKVPYVVFSTQVVGKHPPFHQVLKYIDALDWLLSGNSNEIERLVDALLVIGKTLPKETVDHMDEMKALMNMKTEDRAEYITKNNDPGFREYVSKLLIQEIHKAAHVIDWYNPDMGISGATSGKALKTRLFDMDIYSKRLEMIFREGIETRIELIGNALQFLRRATPSEVTVTFKRTMIQDFEDMVQALMGADFISTRTKVEKVGLDWTKEEDRLKEEQKNRVTAIPTFDGDSQA